MNRYLTELIGTYLAAPFLGGAAAAMVFKVQSPEAR